MKTKIRSGINTRWITLVLILALLLVSLSVGKVASDPLAYPPDPTADIPWTGGMSGVADIQAAFDNARATESTQLGISPALPSLVMPSQANWDALSDSEKALWLINQERAVRGVEPMEGVEANVTSVAQWYADYLLANNATGHTADGRDPWQRLDDNAAINACSDWLNVAENLAYFWTSGSSIPLPVERAVYNWTYDDASSSWGHRHFNLWYPYTAGSCNTGVEGFMGIGRASGPHQGWNFGEIIVMNAFDPCSTWSPCGPTAVDLAGFEAASADGVGALVILLCCGMLVGSGVIVNRRRKD